MKRTATVYMYYDLLYTVSAGLVFLVCCDISCCGECMANDLGVRWRLQWCRGVTEMERGRMEWRACWSSGIGNG